jgi:periplasmic copper chaperone A
MIAARLLFAATVLGLTACGPAPTHEAPSAAATVTASGIELSQMRATPTLGGTTTSAGYFTIVNRGAAEDRLIGASSARAGRAELHEMEMDGAVMRMRPIASVAVPAGGSIAFAPGGMHVMFLDIATPFAEGESVPVTLTFEHAGAVEASFPVSRHEAMSGH